MNKRIFSVLFSLLLSFSVTPVSVFADALSREAGDYSLMRLIPNDISLGFPVYATRSCLNGTSGVTEQEVLASPIGKRIKQTTLEIIRDKLTDYDKAKAIHEWVHSNIRYDHERVRQADPEDKNNSALRTFSEKKAICAGYNYLSALMLYFAEIISVDCNGISRQSADGASFHAWMAAFIDSRWIYFDPTWGEFDIPYNFHQNIEKIKFTDGFYTYEWLAFKRVGIRLQCVVPNNVTVITLPKNFSQTNVRLVDVKDNNIRKVIIPVRFPLSEIDKFFSKFPKLEEVEFEYGITSIPAKTFSDAKNFKRITIPESVTYIGTSVFEDIKSLIIYGKTGSYAERYAKENNISFKALLFESKVTEGKISESKVSENKASENKASENKASENKASENKASENKTSENKASENKASENKTFENKAAENKASENKTSENKTSESKVSERKAPENSPVYLPVNINYVSPTPSTVFVNNKATLFEAYNIDGSNYFKLRDIATAINGTGRQFAIEYDSITMTITLIPGKAYTPVGGEMKPSDGTAKSATLAASRFYLNGKELIFITYNINGNYFFKLRDLSSLLNFAVTYDEATKNIGIVTS